MRGTVLAAVFLLVIVSRISTAFAAPSIRVGFFPNITHAQALIGQSNKAYEKNVGVIEWKGFNAGPSAMEALLAGQLDMAFVGPNPAVNAFMRSRGRSLKVVAGVASGGAGLVIGSHSIINSASDLNGKKIASPGLGNTQDVALRHWLKVKGVKAQVIPAKNSDILLLLKRRQIDGAWVPEPWLTRLIHEANARLFMDERILWPEGKFPTTVMVARSEFLEKHGPLVQKFLDAHIEITEWIIKHPDESKTLINQQLALLQGGRNLQPKILDEAFARIIVTWDPMNDALLKSASWAGDLGYLPGESIFRRSRLQEIFDLRLLNQSLMVHRQKPVK